MATLSSEIRDIWNERIWKNDALKLMTSQIFLYDINNDSQFNVANLYYAEPFQPPTINFFLCLVAREQRPLIMGNIRYTFRVRVEYYLQHEEVSSSTYNTLIDRLETIDDLVRTELTGTWGNTVDFYDGGTALDISVVSIDNKACWKGGFVYLGTKTV